MSYTLTFDGHDLGGLFTVAEVARTVAVFEPTTADVPGRDGALVTGTRAMPVDVIVTLWPKAATHEGRLSSLRTLAAWLAVDEPKALALSDEGGLWRMAMPADTADLTAYVDAASVGVTFRCFDPVLFGEEVSVTVPSGGSLTVEVGGTAPTWPTVSAESARDGSSGYWRLTLDGQTNLDADTGSATVPVTADCERRVLTVNNSVQMLRPAADWLRLTPGSHRIVMNGTGAATLTWRERWW